MTAQMSRRTISRAARRAVIIAASPTRRPTPERRLNAYEHPRIPQIAPARTDVGRAYGAAIPASARPDADGGRDADDSRKRRAHCRADGRNSESGANQDGNGVAFRGESHGRQRAIHRGGVGQGAAHRERRVSARGQTGTGGVSRGGRQADVPRRRGLSGGRGGVVRPNRGMDAAVRARRRIRVQTRRRPRRHRLPAYRLPARRGDLRQAVARGER